MKIIYKGGRHSTNIEKKNVIGDKAIIEIYTCK